MRILHWVVAVLFLVFAAVQFNDPDPWAWALMYGFVAVVAALKALHHLDRRLPLVGLVVAGIWMLTLLPDFIHWVQMGMPTITGSMKAESPHVELTREFLGLVICVVVLGAYWRAGRAEG